MELTNKKRKPNYYCFSAVHARQLSIIFILFFFLCFSVLFLAQTNQTTNSFTFRKSSSASTDSVRLGCVFWCALDCWYFYSNRRIRRIRRYCAFVETAIRQAVMRQTNMVNALVPYARENRIDHRLQRRTKQIRKTGQKKE